MENYFLSKQNYTLLYDIVKTGLHGQWKYDISKDRDNQFLEKLNTVMKQIYRDRANFNLDETSPVAVQVKALNKYTLDFIIPHFGEIIKYTLETNKPSVEPPQRTLQNHALQTSYGKAQLSSPLIERSTATRSVEKKSVMDNYQRLNDERENTLTPKFPKPIDFTLPTGDKSDPSDRYLKMQQQRDTEIDRFKHVRDATNTKGEHKAPNDMNKTFNITKSGIEGYSNMNAQNFAQTSYNDMVEQNKRVDRSIEHSLEELTAQRDKLFQQTLDVKSTKFGTETTPPIQEETTETFLGGKTILETRNQQVFFKKGNESSINPTDLFKMDPNVKQQYDERMSRPEEPRGIVYKQPVETEYRTHYITIDSRDRVKSTVNTASNYVVKFPYMKLKNIKSIKLLSAILPNESDIRDEPYLLISIPEIEGPMFSSNNKNMKIFTKIFNNKNTHNTTLKFLNYMPEPVQKVYPINALGSLEQLSIKLHKHDGNDVGMDGVDDEDITSFTFEIVQTVADTSSLQSNMI